MAAEITANADKEVTVILANAEKSSQILKGRWWKKKQNICWCIWQRSSSSFYDYAGYEKALIGGETSLILSPDSEFFKFLEILNKTKSTIIQKHERANYSFRIVSFL